jgi:hypothetical protein
MAAPDKKQYTERPRKVLAAAYDPAADPPQAVFCPCGARPAPHVHVDPGPGRVIVETDVLVWDAAVPDRLVAVLTAEEFAAQYGNVPTVGGV